MQGVSVFGISTLEISLISTIDTLKIGNWQGKEVGLMEEGEVGSLMANELKVLPLKKTLFLNILANP